MLATSPDRILSLVGKLPGMQKLLAEEQKKDDDALSQKSRALAERRAAAKEAIFALAKRKIEAEQAVKKARIALFDAEQAWHKVDSELNGFAHGASIDLVDDEQELLASNQAALDDFHGRLDGEIERIDTNRNSLRQEKSDPPRWFDGRQIRFNYRSNGELLARRINFCRDAKVTASELARTCSPSEFRAAIAKVWDSLPSIELK